MLSAPSTYAACSISWPRTVTAGDLKTNHPNLHGFPGYCEGTRKDAVADLPMSFWTSEKSLDDRPCHKQQMLFLHIYIYTLYIYIDPRKFRSQTSDNTDT